MEISEQEFITMQATIRDLQEFKDNHIKNEERELKEYLAKRAAMQQENAAKIFTTKSLLK